MLLSEAQAAEKAVIASSPDERQQQRHADERREPREEERQDREDHLVGHDLPADLERRDGGRDATSLLNSR